MCQQITLKPHQIQHKYSSDRKQIIAVYKACLKVALSIKCDRTYSTHRKHEIPVDIQSSEGVYP